MQEELKSLLETLRKCRFGSVPTGATLSQMESKIKGMLIRLKREDSKSLTTTARCDSVGSS